jgi:hypothetical protein
VAALADVRTLKLNLLADVDKFGRGMADADKAAKGLDNNVARYSKNMAKAFAAVVAAAGIMAVQIGRKAVDSASDLAESVSKVEQIFGDASDEVVNFSKTTAESLGISQRDALDAASTFATFGKSAGLAGEELVDFSSDFTTLAADFASFYNTSPQDAILAIGAALRGEAEPIRKYGILLDDATLKQAAWELKIYDGNGALTAQEKVLAAQQVIMQQSSDAQGDFARTQEGLANQSRILKARLEDVSAEIGVALLPKVLEMVTFFQEKVLPIMEQVADGFSGKPRSLSNKVLGLADAMGMPQDQGGYNLGAALRNVAEAFEAMFAALNSDENADGTLNNIADAMNNVADGINAVSNAYRNAKSVFADVKTTAIGQLLFGSWGPGGMFPGLLNPSSSYGSRAAGGSVMAGQPYRVGEFGPETFVPSGSGSIRPDSGGSGVTIIMNGVIDGESARRSIERLLQDSSRRTGAVNLVGATL